MPVCFYLSCFPLIRNGRRKNNAANDNRAKASIIISQLKINSANTALINAATARFKKNIAGMNISNTKNKIDIINIICHIT